MTQTILKQSDDQTQDSSSELSTTQEGVNEVNHPINVNRSAQVNHFHRRQLRGALVSIVKKRITRACYTCVLIGDEIRKRYALLTQDLRQ